MELKDWLIPLLSIVFGGCSGAIVTYLFNRKRDHMQEVRRILEKIIIELNDLLLNSIDFRLHMDSEEKNFDSTISNFNKYTDSILKLKDLSETHPTIIEKYISSFESDLHDIFIQCMELSSNSSMLQYGQISELKFEAIPKPEFIVTNKQEYYDFVWNFIWDSMYSLKHKVVSVNRKIR